VLGLSRTAVVKLLEDGDITTGGKAMPKSDRVTAGQVIDVLMPAPINTDPIPLTPLEGLTIVYDDQDIVVVDKPVGCAAHPSPGWTGPTVVGALMAAGYSVSTSGPAERQGIVHRLDVGTSGLMIVAKSDTAFHVLKDAFRNRTIEKIYHAMVQGHMDPTTGTIDAPIDRHPKEDHRFAVVATGKESITHYEVIEFYRGVSMVKVELETGRTHQIRVHFSALHHHLLEIQRMGQIRYWLRVCRWLDLGFTPRSCALPTQLLAKPSTSKPHTQPISHARWRCFPTPFCHSH
jgi:23S rRNA pseudouridine1911/1915/1917 synthase